MFSVARLLLLLMAVISVGCTTDTSAPATSGPATDGQATDGRATDDESGDPAALVVNTDQVAAAEVLCPVMWAWTKDLGEIFNQAARDVGQLPEAGDRRARWFDAFDDVDDRNARLLADVAVYGDDPVLAPLVAEIERDLPAAGDELDDIRLLFTEHPEIDENRHQERTSQVIVRWEKVIDLPKPALAGLDEDGSLRAAFRTVPACQHSVKDVNDGTIQANG